MQKNTNTLAKIVREMMKKNREDQPYFISEGRTDPFNIQGITKEELVNRMGLSTWEEIKKRLNRQRPLDRDFLIALSLQLQLNVKMVNYILNTAEFPLLYSGEESNDEDPVINERERLLIAKLNESTKRLVSIDEINQSLCHQSSSPLKIRGRKIIDYPCDYSVLKYLVKVDYDEGQSWTDGRSLGTWYDIDSYPIAVIALVKHNNQEDYFILKVCNKGGFLSKSDENGKIIGPLNSFESLEDIDLSLRPIFNDLENLLVIEKKKILTQFDDTKNYDIRVSANYISGSFHVFAEKFDFFIPERNEYFFLDYHDGQYDFSISNKSQFYYYYLGENRYKSFFRKYNPKIIYSSHDIDELKSYLNDDGESKGLRILNSKRIDSFINLILETEKLINKLKNGTIFITDLNYFFEEPEIDYTVCSYYDIRDKFNFYLMDKDAPIDFYLPGVQEFTFVFEGKKVLINLDDVRKAYSYGLPTIDDICFVKLKYGSIENLINNL